MTDRLPDPRIINDVQKYLDDPEYRRAFDWLTQHPEELPTPEDQIKPIKTTWTAAELASTDFPDPRWAVPGIVPVGLSSLAGRPKLGKSWLALQIAHAVGCGGKLFNLDIDAGKVLYMALEDSPRRLKNRLVKQGIPPDANITFETSWRSFSEEGGLIDLQAAIGNEGYTLVIIDTLSRAIGRSDQQDLAEMTTIIGSLQRLALNDDIALLTVDHHRKANGFDANPIDDIMGSTGKAAVLDAVIGLYREQGKHEATLKVVGRDIEEQELALRFDGVTGCWQSLGAANEVREDTQKAEILAAIDIIHQTGELPTTTRVAQHTGIDKGNVSRMLAELLSLGKVKKGQKSGREVPYELPTRERGSL